MKEKRPILCFGANDWDYLFHRPQQLMLRFAREGYPVHYKNPGRILGIAPEMVAPNLLVYRDFEKLPKALLTGSIWFIYSPAFLTWHESQKDNYIIFDYFIDDPAFDVYIDRMLNEVNMVLYGSDRHSKEHSDKGLSILYLPNGIDNCTWDKKFELLLTEMKKETWMQK